MIVVGLWLWSLGVVLVRGWIWESDEVVDPGGLLERYRYFDIEYTPVCVWLTMILLGYGAHLFRKWSLGWYGFVEVLCGLTGGVLSMGRLPLEHPPAWIGLVLSAFIIVRGAGNISLAVAEKEARGGRVLGLEEGSALRVLEKRGRTPICESMTEIPNSLFKYVPPERIDITESLCICFSRRPSFNDPFDLNPVTPSFTQEEWEAITNDTLKKRHLVEVARGSQMSLEAYLTTQKEEKAFLVNVWKHNARWLREQAAERIGKRIDGEFGVFCLTEIENDLLMWAHYAKDHSGMMIEFDPTRLKPPSEPSLYEEKLEIVSRVEYSDDRPQISWTGKITDSGIFLVKSPQWGHEREWRAIRKLSDCDHRKPTSEGTVHLFKLPPEAIKRVVIGCRMEARSVHDAVSANPALKHVKLQKAVINMEHFRLDYVDLDEMPAPPPRLIRFLTKFMGQDPHVRVEDKL